MKGAQQSGGSSFPDHLRALSGVGKVPYRNGKKEALKALIENTHHAEDASDDLAVVYNDRIHRIVFRL